MVGAAGFEPATTCSQSRCATRLRYTPVCLPHSTTTTGILPCPGTCSASSLLLSSAALRKVTRPRNMHFSAFVVYDKPQSRCATRLRYTPVCLPHSTTTTGILPCPGTCSASSLLLSSAALRKVTRPRNMHFSAFVVYDKPQSRCATRLRYTPVCLSHSKRQAILATADSPRDEVERPTRTHIGWPRILSGRRPACEHHLQTAGFSLPNCGPSRSVRKSAHFSQPP